MRSRQRTPIGEPGRWRNGRARRLAPEDFRYFEARIAVVVAERLAAKMRASDIASAELAAALGVSKTAVIQWTTGIELPSLRRLVTICVALRCGLFDLLPDQVDGRELAAVFAEGAICAP